MKTRQSLVSNSSSSSFIVIHKRDDWHRDKLIHETVKILDESRGEDEPGDERNLDWAKELAKNNEYILMYSSVDYGSEEITKHIVKELCEKLEIKNIRIEERD